MSASKRSLASSGVDSGAYGGGVISATRGALIVCMSQGVDGPACSNDADDEEDEAELGELEVWLPSSTANWRITL